MVLSFGCQQEIVGCIKQVFRVYLVLRHLRQNFQIKLIISDQNYASGSLKTINNTIFGVGRLESGLGWFLGWLGLAIFLSLLHFLANKPNLCVKNSQT